MDRARWRRSAPRSRRSPWRAWAGSPPGRAGAQEAGDLAAGLDEAEDVVDEQQHVLPALVRGRTPRRARAPSSRRGSARPAARSSGRRPASSGRAPRGAHLDPELVPRAIARRSSCEHGDAAPLRDRAPDELHQEHRLADPGPAEEPCLAPARERREQIDHLDARGVDSRARTSARAAAPGGRSGGAGCPGGSAALIERVTEDIDQPAQRGLSHGHRDRRPGGRDARPALQAPGEPEGHRPHVLGIELLLHPSTRRRPSTSSVSASPVRGAPRRGTRRRPPILAPCTRRPRLRPARLRRCPPSSPSASRSGSAPAAISRSPLEIASCRAVRPRARARRAHPAGRAATPSMAARRAARARTRTPSPSAQTTWARQCSSMIRATSAAAGNVRGSALAPPPRRTRGSGGNSRSASGPHPSARWRAARTPGIDARDRAAGDRAEQVPREPIRGRSDARDRRSAARGQRGDAALRQSRSPAVPSAASSAGPAIVAGDAERRVEQPSVTRRRTRAPRRGPRRVGAGGAGGLLEGRAPPPRRADRAPGRAPPASPRRSARTP